MPAYGCEQHAATSSAARKVAHRFFGTYDLGARVRYSAMEQALNRICEPRTILDAGSGRGQLTFAMHRRWPNAKILAVDCDEALVAHAQSLQLGEDPRGRIHFEQRMLPDNLQGHYDLVTSVDVLEHVEDDAGFIRCLYDATAFGGHLLLHTPATPQRRFLAEFEEQHDHVRDGYSPEDLETLLKGAGYSHVDIRYTFGTLGAIGWEGFALARQGNIAAKSVLPLWYLLSGFDSMRAPRRGNGLFAVAAKT